MKYTWTELNNLLRKLRSVEAVEALLEEQRRLGASDRWRRRIWGRLKVLRNVRERRDILKPYRGPRMPRKEKV